VLIVHRNHANVKCFTLWRRPSLHFSGSPCSCAGTLGFGVDGVATSLLDDNMAELRVGIDEIFESQEQAQMKHLQLWCFCDYPDELIDTVPESPLHRKMGGSSAIGCQNAWYNVVTLSTVMDQTLANQRKRPNRSLQNATYLLQGY
jgi:hypothetical protein